MKGTKGRNESYVDLGLQWLERVKSQERRAQRQGRSPHRSAQGGEVGIANRGRDCW